MMALVLRLEEPGCKYRLFLRTTGIDLLPYTSSEYRADGTASSKGVLLL
jgi:hypothetical protein